MQTVVFVLFWEKNLSRLLRDRP